MKNISKSPFDPRRSKQGFYVIRERGKSVVVLVDDPPPRKGGKAATPEEIAAMHARRKAYLDEYLAQKEAKRKANQSRRSA